MNDDDRTIFYMDIINDDGGGSCTSVAIEDNSWRDRDSCVLTGFSYDGFAILTRDEARKLGEALLKWSK